MENEAFVRPHDQTYFTKLIADKQKITIEYYSEDYVLYPSSGHIVVNDDDTQKMVSYIKKTINSHPKILHKYLGV
jgi:hypothetical protein